MSIKTHILQLVKLQKIELDIKNINKLMLKIPEELEVLERQRNEFEKKIEDARNTIETLQKQYRAGESDSQAIVSRMEKEEDKLRSVKNNKEYQALLAGIEHLKTDQAAIEDRMLECLEEIEGAEATLSEQSAALKRFEVKLSRERDAINRKADQAKKELNEKQKTCSELEDSIDPAFIKRYRHVRAAKAGGVAIAPVHNAVCKGCHMNIPPQVYNDLQRFEALTVCPKCQRIIYWEMDPSDEEAADESAEK